MPIHSVRTPRIALTVLLLAVVACADSARSGTNANLSTAPAAPTTAPVGDVVIDPGDGGEYEPEIDPARFGSRIDNPFLPYLPGARWVYEGSTEDGEIERIEVSVTDERRTILGVETIVVHDVVTIDGEIIEDTHDWYAQDDDGNVWYFGEDSTSYDEGRVSKAGSWEAGVDGALPGIVMHAHPSVGVGYREEFFPGEAEDLAEVVAVDGAVDTPFGSFEGMVVTINWTPLEPELIERKYYATGVGFVYETFDRGPSETVGLIEYTPGE